MVDNKRSLFAGPTIGIQTAAYTHFWNRTYKSEQIKNENRFALVLRPLRSPPYQLERYKDADDLNVFLSLLITYRWMQKHGKNFKIINPTE